jgi:hypothetical protein
MSDAKSDKGFLGDIAEELKFKLLNTFIAVLLGRTSLMDALIDGEWKQ